ncbi:MMPL family transporter [Mycobacterium sp.]|uniref:MMPL family transporter n=1 Tax=Mycobacterium sp. TaxID=1785 RepID=UPI003BAC7F92
MHREPRRRRRWLLPALTLLAWLVIGSLGGPYAGKLAAVAQNDSSAFLPVSAESTRAGDVAKEFGESSSLPAVIVAERQGALTDADSSFLAGIAASVTGIAGVTAPASPQAISADGKAAEIVVPISASDDPTPTVNAIRHAVGAGAPAGLRVLVTGPAAQIADLSKAFSGIDTTLLLVAGIMVIIILVAVYRSPLLPLIVLVSAVFALSLASAIVYMLASTGAIALNGQSQGILFILVFGAATDYALLLVARFREELRHDGDRFGSMRQAWRAVLAPIGASAGTVILGVLCLLLSDLNSNRGLGPVAAIGIACSLVAALTFLPAVLTLVGRRVFWPLRPEREPDRETGLWWRLARQITVHRTSVWIVAGLLLLVCAGFAPQLKSSGTSQSAVFLTQVESVSGQRVLAAHFPGGSGSPTLVITRADTAPQVVEIVAAVPGVSAASIGAPGRPPVVVDNRVQIQATLSDPADSQAAVATVSRIRAAVHAVPGSNALVGGPTATQLDTQSTAARDRRVIIPIVLIVVLVILVVLLRALVAPLLLIGTVVLSFAATLGVAAMLFNHVFHFAGSDPVVPLFGFVFLVALGVDYNIFLMTRVREETVQHGTTVGIQRGLAVTGGVITSAGIVLAATFGALAVIPLLFLAQLAFIVAFGVLLDTLVVRSLLVPALALQIGPITWWPSLLARQRRSPDTAHTAGVDRPSEPEDATLR